MDKNTWYKEITELEDRVTEKYGSAVVAVVNYLRMNDQLKEDEDLSLIAVATNSDNVKYMPEHLKTPAFCKRAYELNPKVFPLLAYKLAGSYDVVMNVLAETPENFEHLPASLKNDSKFCLEAVMQNPDVFRHLGENQTNDRLIAFHAINGSPSLNLTKFSPYQENFFLLGTKLKGELFEAGATEFEAAKKFLSSATLSEKLTTNLPAKQDKKPVLKMKI
jgi:hypothetical protein